MKYYRLKYRLGMEHSFNAKEENRHRHLLEINLFVREKAEQGTVSFYQLEKLVDHQLAPFQNKYLNALDVFQGNTSIENIGEIFYELLETAFDEADWVLARLEISETPLRVYAISVADEELS